MPPTPEQIAAQIENVKGLASTMVTGAIEAYMSGTQTGWYGSLGNNDDEIGTQACTILQDDFGSSNLIAITQSWSGDNGSWTIGGTSSIWTAPSSHRPGRLQNTGRVNRRPQW
jgi:hypothetical protein